MSVADTSGVEQRRAFLYVLAYLITLHAVPFVNMLLGGVVPVFIVVNAVAAYSGWLTIRYLYRSVTAGPFLTPLDLAITGYLFLSAGSFLLYFQSEHPVPAAAFAYGVHHLLIPIGVFFAVKATGPDERRRLIRWICLLNVGLMTIGLILYIMRPAFFTDFVTSSYIPTSQVVGEVQSRMTSYVGSTAVGMVAAITIVLLPAARLGALLSGLFVAVLVVGAALSQQRGGFVATLLALGYYVFAARARLRWKVMSVVLGALLLAGVTAWVNANYSSIVELLLHRFFSIREALTERAYAYTTAGSYFRDFPFGVGLGATVSAAGRTALNLRGEITDANFARILADLGLAGLIVFVTVLALGVRRAIRLRGGFGWVVLLGVYCVVALGTNVFDTYYIGHLFWLLLGIVDSRPVSPASAHAPFAVPVPVLVAGRT